MQRTLCLDGYELHEPAPLGTQKLVHFERMFSVIRLNHGQRVELHAAALESLQPRVHVVKRGMPSLVHAITVVQGAGTVHGQPHQELVGRQKLRPFVVDQHTVGLEGVVQNGSCGDDWQPNECDQFLQ